MEWAYAQSEARDFTLKDQVEKLKARCAATKAELKWRRAEEKHKCQRLAQARAKTSAMATRASAAEEALESVKQELSALRAWKKEVSEKHLERYLLNEELSYGDYFEYEKARDLTYSFLVDFPAWMRQSVAESGYGPGILESCAWALDRKEEGYMWGRSAALSASFLEAELWVIEHKYKKASAGKFHNNMYGYLSLSKQV